MEMVLRPLNFTQAMRAVSTSLIVGGSLIACAVPGILWETTKWEGPLIEGNKRAAVVQRCDLGPRGISDVTFCDRAFVDHNGTKVDVTRDVRDAIDSSLSKVEPFVPWVKVPKPYGSPSAPERGRLPYRLHILTISPLIVLAVPRDKDDTDYCAGNVFVEGCLPTAKLSLEPYWWKRGPKVRAGSFWFSPDLSVLSQYLPDGQTSHIINLKGSRIDLAANGDVWHVKRYAAGAR